jgi:hypothetical protein
MLLTIKKQIEENIEVKTPCYFKDIFGHCYINENGQLVTVKKSMVYVWDSTYGRMYTEEVGRIIRDCTPCNKEEFDKAYAEVKAGFDIAAGAVEF